MSMFTYMRHAFRTAPLIHKPNWYLVTSIALLLSVGIFAISFALFRSKGVHGISPVLSIVHVGPTGRGSIQTDVSAMRDGRFFVTITSVSLLSFSKCKQRTGTLPRQVFEQCKSILAPEFQTSRSARLPACVNGRQCWYMQARVGNTYHCAAFSGDDAKANLTFQKLVNCYTSVNNMDSGQFGKESDCSSGAPNYYEDWCSGKGLE